MEEFDPYRVSSAAAGASSAFLGSGRSKVRFDDIQAMVESIHAGLFKFFETELKPAARGISMDVERGGEKSTTTMAMAMANKEES